MDEGRLIPTASQEPFEHQAQLDRTCFSEWSGCFLGLSRCPWGASVCLPPHPHYIPHKRGAKVDSIRLGHGEGCEQTPLTQGQSRHLGSGDQQ